MRIDKCDIKNLRSVFIDYAKKNRDLMYINDGLFEKPEEAIFAPMKKIEGDMKIAIKLNAYGEFVIGGIKNVYYESLSENGRITSLEVKWLKDMLDFIDKGKKIYLNREEEEKKRKENSEKLKPEELMISNPDPEEYFEEAERRLRSYRRTTDSA